MYATKPLSCKSLTTNWARSSAEYLGPEFGTCFVNISDADHARDIRDRCSTTSTIHLLNGVAVSWLCKKQSVSTLHSTGSEIIALATGAKGTINGRAFFSGLGYPIAGATDTMEDNQATIKCILSSRIHSNTRHLTTRISWLHEMFACDIIKPHYTKTSLQLSNVNTKPLCGAAYHSKLAFLFGPRFYPSHTSNTTFLYFFLIARYIRIILREVLLHPLLHLLSNFLLSDSFEALRFSNVGGCLGYSVSPGLLQFPGLRITPYWRYQTRYLRTLYYTYLVSVPTYAHHHRLARP
jgi:hypothetical protein